MLNASTPFYHRNVEKMYEQISTGEFSFSKIVSISNVTKDFIKKVIILLIE